MYDNYQNDKYETGKVIVTLNKNFTPIGAQRYDIGPLLNGLDFERAEVIYHAKTVEKKSDEGDILLIYLKNQEETAVDEAIQKLSSNPNVMYAEPDYTEELHAVPNDPLFSQLWGTRRAKAPLAWNVTTGSSNVTVGVIDSGIDYTHPDVRNNMWNSPNGQIRNGWNFAANGTSPMDLNGHGTHVAGTIGAVGNNRIGIPGICWTVQLVSMKFGLDIASAIAAINFANYFHISILNASWGGRAYSHALKHAIEQYDGLFIASAGNNGANNDLEPVYPASYDCKNIISVAATDPYDNLARFSNYGIDTVDIAAPGTNILSLELFGGYTPMNGTSMAAPHVAGAAALLKSYAPNLSSLELKDIILSSAVTIPSLKVRISTSGLLDINAMLKLAKKRCR